MIAEEPEDGNTKHDGKDATDSCPALPRMVQSKEENFTFPKRSRCRKTNTRKVDWVEMLAKATEEDKKANIDVTISPENSDSDESENKPPQLITTSVLDLSSVSGSSEKRYARKGYTMPTYEPQYRAQTHLMRSTPLKELNSSSNSHSAQRLFREKQQRDADVAAKKALFNSNHVYYEREVVSHNHIMIRQSPKEYDFSRATGMQPIDYGLKSPHLDQGRAAEQYSVEAIREYGHSNTSGFYTQLYTGRNPSHPAQSSCVDEQRNLQHHLPQHPPRDNV